jgi:pectinesterase
MHCSIVPALLAIVSISAGASTSSAQQTKDRFTVASDGSADFKTVQEAVDAIPSKNDHRVVIEIRPGTYKQVVTVPKDKPMLAFVGTDAEHTILTFDNYAQRKGPDGKEFGTRHSGSTFISGADFVAENITFENSAGPVGQAVALFVNADRCVFRRCRMIGWQDTVYVNANRQYFEDCFISGHVDYIFGSSICWFEKCELRCRRGGSITAASTPQDSLFGYVFSHCKITKDADAPTSSTILGRPWRPYSAVTFLTCDMADIVEPRGWDNWGKTENEQTARYAEYKSTGPGAKSGERLPWTKQLSDDQAKEITVQKVLGGKDNWDPTTVHVQQQ